MVENDAAGHGVAAGRVDCERPEPGLAGLAGLDASQLRVESNLGSGRRTGNLCGAAECAHGIEAGRKIIGKRCRQRGELCREIECLRPYEPDDGDQERLDASLARFHEEKRDRMIDHAVIGGLAKVSVKR